MFTVRISTSTVSAFDISFYAFSHLSNSTYRETYESAHSVMLAVFAAHAQKASQLPAPRLATSGGNLASYISQIIPFYTDCLLEVSLTASCHCLLVRFPNLQVRTPAKGNSTPHSYVWHMPPSSGAQLHSDKASSNCPVRTPTGKCSPATASKSSAMPSIESAP